MNYLVSKDPKPFKEADVKPHDIVVSKGTLCRYQSAL